MPRYFFDIHNDGQDMRDEEGSHLADDRSAELEAIGVLQDISRSLENQGDLQASVRNEAGRIIFKAKIALTTERMQTA